MKIVLVGGGKVGYAILQQLTKEGHDLILVDNNMQVVEEVKKYFKEKVYRTVVPRNVRLGEAPSHGKPAVVYDGSSRGSKAYVELAGEILQRNKEGKHG